MKIRNTTVSNYNYNIFDTCYNLTDYNDISSFKKYSIIFGLKHGIILKSKRKTKEKIPIDTPISDNIKLILLSRFLVFP